MARSHARIGTDMPDEQSVRALSVGAQWLYDRLLLSKELSRCGVLPLRIALWSDRAPDASEKKVRGWLKELTASRHVVTDERYQEAFVRTYVRHDGLLGQPNVVAAMVSDYGLVASPTIRVAFMLELRRIWDLADLPESERGGWLLAVGHYPEVSTGQGEHRTWPAVLPAASLARLRKSIGTGLHAHVTRAMAAGDLPPFDEASPQGIPEPFTRTLPGTPIRARDRGERRTPSPATNSERRLPPPDGSGDPAPAEAAGLAAARTRAEHLVDTAQLGPLSAPVRRGLHERTATALNLGATDDDVHAALAVWRRRPGAGPGLLTNLIVDARNGQLAAAATAGPRSRAAETLALAERLDHAHGGTR